MKARVYIETSVVSYYTARASRDIVVAGHQQATQELWGRFGIEYEPCVSAIVVKEAGGGDPERADERLRAIASFPALDVDEEAGGLAAKILAGGAIPQEYPEDALHVAVAAVNGLEILLTWNFTHLNNPFTRMMLRQVIENEGYHSPEICSPDELLESDR